MLYKSSLFWLAVLSTAVNWSVPLACGVGHNTRLERYNLPGYGRGRSGNASSLLHFDFPFRLVRLTGPVAVPTVTVNKRVPPDRGAGHNSQLERATGPRC